MTKAVLCFEEIGIGQEFTRFTGAGDMRFMKTTEVVAKNGIKCNAVCVRAQPGLKTVQGWHYHFKPKEVVEISE